MTTRTRATIAAGVAVLGVAAVPAAAHNLDGEANCTAATFRYSLNAAGEQRSTETVTVDGATVYGPALRVFTTTGRVDAFPVSFPAPLTPGSHVVAGRAVFVGSDGYRYTRTFSATVECAAPPAPEPPPVTPPPPPPVTPPTTPEPEPAPVPTPEPVKPRPPQPVKPLPPLPRPTSCLSYAKRPARSITRGVPKRPGIIRVRRGYDGRWYGFRGDRWIRVRIPAAGGRPPRIVVVFAPGEFCGPVHPEVTG